MKLSSWLVRSMLITVLAAGVAGCKKTPKSPTPIPGARIQAAPDGGRTATFPPISPGPAIPSATDDSTRRIPSNATGIPTTPREEIEGMIPDREAFKLDTVYFDFDRSAVKESERGKVQNVANHLKANGANKVQVEGHCDERGTEEYNRALGERRALEVRAYLVNLGIEANRIFTISYGEDKPAMEGEGEAVWSKNRRGEFILLTPKP